MSRHSKVVVALDALQETDAIDGWVRDSHPNEPLRARWIVQVDPLTRLHLNTPEAEAFIAGAKATMKP